MHAVVSLRSPIPPLRSGSEVQACASIAGNRLNRVLGGASGHFAVDAAWSAYFSRCNEVILVAVYLTSADATEAMRATESAKGALIDLCGGKLLDVVLPSLSRLGLEVQLAVRKAAAGHGGRLYGTATTKGVPHDITSISLGPEPLADDAASVAMRATNDVTAPGRSTTLADAFTAASSKGDALGDGLRSVRLPASAVESPAAIAVLAALDEAVTAGIRCARRGRPPLASLLPPPRCRRTSPPPAAVVGIVPPVDASEEGDSEGEGSGQRLADFLWTPSAEAAAAASGADLSDFVVDFPASPPPPTENVSIRIAVQISESVALSSRAGGGESAVLEGTAVLKYMPTGGLSPAVQESGHCAAPFLVMLRVAAPLASLTVCAPGGKPQAVPLPPLSAGEPALYALPLTLPARPAMQAGNPAADLATVAYKFAPGYVPAFVKAAATARLVCTLTDAGTMRHTATDVTLRSLLAPSMTAATGQVQFLVQMTPPPLPSGGQPPVYDPATAKPGAVWGKGTLLWALQEGAGLGSSADTAPATNNAHFAPGVPAEFTARVPVSGGATFEVGTVPAGEAPLPLQLRFTCTNGGIVPAAVEPLGPDTAQLETVDGEVSGHTLTTHVVAVLTKVTSQVRCMVR